MENNGTNSLPEYFRYWGKAKNRPADQGSGYHLLVFHCLDVAAIGWHLLDPAASLVKQLAARLGVDSSWLRNWFCFCLCLHDLGKFARAFQGLAPKLSSNLVSADTRCVYQVRHDALGHGYWLKTLSPAITDVLPSELHHAAGEWLSIVFGHHGHPIDAAKASRAIRSHSTDADEFAVELYFRELVALWMPEFSPLAGIKKRVFRQCSWQLAGVAVLADWLGSNQTIFQYRSEPIPLEDYWTEIALPRAREAITASSLKPKAIAPFKSISQQFNFIQQPTPLQDCAQKLPLIKGPQLLILEDVTGAGKTEAAMVLAHRLMASGRASGLYVGLPTMATANAMYERLAQSYRALYANSVTPSIVLAHGASQQSEAFQQSVKLLQQQADRQYQPDDQTASAYCNQWLADNRKKALLADVGVGTIDQALLAVLPARHQSLRLLGLADKVLLIDEVHAFDPYMQRLLEALLTVHASQGGNAILLSATLPADHRERFVAAFQLGITKGDESESPPALQERYAYPLITHTAEDYLNEIRVETRDSVRRKVLVQRAADETTIFRKIQRATEQGQCVCWIRNTVSDARSSFNYLLDQDWIPHDRITLFHSRYAMIDRQHIEQDVLARFGKHSGPHERNGQILIATQVVEQSLDLDFDLMISDLAPIDLLLQRAGRLQRHCRNLQGQLLNSGGDQRPHPILIVLSPSPNQVEDSQWLKRLLPKTSFIYPNVGELWRSISTLEENQGFTMPEDARQLIESVYGQNAPAIPTQLEQASLEAFAEQKVQSNMGSFNTLRLDDGYSRESAMHNGGWDEDVHLPTRLGADTVDVALATIKQNCLQAYASQSQHPWALSQVKIPAGEWEQAKQHIPESYQSLIEETRKNNPALQWLEIWPLTEGLENYYDVQTGWNIRQECP